MAGQTGPGGGAGGVQVPPPESPQVQSQGAHDAPGAQSGQAHAQPPSEPPEPSEPLLC